MASDRARRLNHWQMGSGFDVAQLCDREDALRPLRLEVTSYALRGS